MKKQKQFVILEEYLNGFCCSLDRVKSKLEEHLNGHQFELAQPFKVTLIPVKGSAFYLLECGDLDEDDAADEKIAAAEIFMSELCGDI